MIENKAFPMLPNATPDVVSTGINVGEVLIPLPLAQAIVVGILALMSWRLFKGFRKNQKKD